MFTADISTASLVVLTSLCWDAATRRRVALKVCFLTDGLTCNLNFYAVSYSRLSDAVVLFYNGSIYLLYCMTGYGFHYCVVFNVDVLCVYLIVVIVVYRAPR